MSTFQERDLTIRQKNLREITKYFLGGSALGGGALVAINAIAEVVADGSLRFATLETILAGAAGGGLFGILNYLGTGTFYTKENQNSDNI